MIDDSTEDRNQGEPRYWAFVATPVIYRIEDSVREQEFEYWPTKNKDIRRGDRVLVWKAKGRDLRRGIIALGRVETDPQLLEDPSSYWTDPDRGNTRELRVKVRYDIPDFLPIWLDETGGNFLNQFNFARSRGGTVFSITEDDWRRITAAADCSPSTYDDVGADSPLSGNDSEEKGGQGYRASANAIRCIDAYAMSRAVTHFLARGWSVEDVSRTIKVYDLRCKSPDGIEAHVEVKGTVSGARSIILTRNEVDHVRQFENTILFIVAGIRVTQEADRFVASGGEERVIEPWSLSEDRLSPTQFVYTVLER